MGPRYGVSHVAGMTDGDELLKGLGFALLAASELHVDAFQFLQLAVDLLHRSLLRFGLLVATAWADRRRPERRKALRASAHRWRWLAATCAPCAVLKRPLADVVGEAVTGDVTDVIKDDRGVLAWCWPQHATDLLQVQAKAGGGS